MGFGTLDEGHIDTGVSRLSAAMAGAALTLAAE
jgi:hypothetical protein